MAIFNELTFNVNKEIFFEVFKNPDKGFGFDVELDKELFTPIQIETLEYLLRCQEKHLMGSVTIIFKLEGVGEITKLSRRVEKLSYKKGKYVMEAFY